MHEATDYDSLDQMQLRGVMADFMCGNENERDTTKLFTEYVAVSILSTERKQITRIVER